MIYLIVLSWLTLFNYPSYPFNGVIRTEVSTGIESLDIKGTAGHIVIIPDARIIMILYSSKEYRQLQYISSTTNTYKISRTEGLIVEADRVIYYNSKYSYEYILVTQ